jgi:AcrR family transcriptional regulator
MARKYDGSRRTEAAERTRNQILTAAFRLHGEGIIDLEVLAKEADVSVATVRKHFPKREILFENCTAYGMHFVSMPDIDAIQQVDDPSDRTERAVREVYSLHESLIGQTWTAFKYEQESSALAATLKQIDDLVSLVADVVLEVWPSAQEAREAPRRVLIAMLSPLTYRALRVHGGLEPAEAVAQTAAMLVRTLTASAAREETVYR